MKIVYLVALASFALVSCDGGKKQAPPPDVPAAGEQAVPKTPGEKILAVLLFIQDQAAANAHAAEVKELAKALPRDIPHEESVNIMNELLRLASRECYGSRSLEDALKGIQFDAGEYTGSVPLDVDGFEPPRTSRRNRFPCVETADCFRAFSVPSFPENELRKGNGLMAPEGAVSRRGGERCCMFLFQKKERRKGFPFRSPEFSARMGQSRERKLRVRGAAILQWLPPCLPG